MDYHEIMPYRELTPSQHRTLSFLHSQGSGTAQLRVVDYIEKVAEILPDTDDSHEAIEHFARYLAQTAERGDHMDVRLYHQASEMTLSEFKHRVTRRVPAKYLSKDRIVTELTLSLVYQENVLLNPDKPDTTAINGVTPQNHRRRMAKRVLEGRTSFIEYYGQQQHSTHYEAYDHMYTDIGACLENPALPDWYPLTQTLIDRHRQLVDNAEANFPASLLER